MACKGQFGTRFKEFAKKALIILLYKVFGWITYTYIEEGFALTDCLFDNDNIRRLKATNITQSKVKLYNDLNITLEGELDGKIFDIYYKEFRTYFDAKEPTSSSVSIHEICTKWYQFTAITLTTVGKVTTMCLVLKISNLPRLSLEIKKEIMPRYVTSYSEKISYYIRLHNITKQTI